MTMTDALAGTAVVISLAAVWAAASSAKSGKRAANAAEASEKHAAVSAQASLDSAEAAKLSAEADGMVARVELERNHDGCRPGNAGGAFHFEPSPHVIGAQNLIFTFTPPRAYRLKGRTSFGPEKGHGALSSSPTMILEAGKSVRVNVDQLYKDRPQSQVKVLEMWFWPALEEDPGEPWTCRCGRDVDPEEEPHWVWNVPVELPPLPPSLQRAPGA